MRIALVNDTRLAIEALRQAVSSRGYQVAWVAADGAAAVQQCRQDTPDLILMDLVMPVLDGVEATRRIMAESPCAILIVTASMSGRSGQVFQALGMGALDVVRTPSRADGFEPLLSKIATIEKLLQYRRLPTGSLATGNGSDKSGESILVAIGASAGGPRAVSTVLAGLPRPLAVPVVIVQHLDKDFADSLAGWLDQQSEIRVQIAPPGSLVVPGRGLLAGTGLHMVMTPGQRLQYQAEPLDLPYRPSIDTFFESVARYWKGPVIAVLLTGMGRDGAAGLLKLKMNGHHTIAQDEATSTVYGMPRAAAEMRAAVEILPLPAIGAAIGRRLKAC
ncbi:MAG TPA: chemotaxis-specific protein-glutamate methyltransferase CheB [Candidatus Xenobia bacterium]|jgi:chemotaxis response regulator CheB